ncbi:MAG: hypothetical protein RLZZ04_4764 [Cyanobacteriota bacterium]|jgi:uncharacterized protein YeaC (DUF1315 family)
MIAFKIMTDNKDNPKKQEQTSESHPQDATETSQQPTKKKERFKFKEEDMYKIKYNF